MSDIDLVRKIGQGDKQALTAFYHGYRDIMLRLALSLAVDVNLAEDIVHDVLLSIVRSARHIKLKTSLKSYLAASIANRARTLLRDSKRLELMGENHDLDVNTGQIYQPDQWLILTESIRQLRDAMAQLPYEQREAVNLHIQGEMTFRQIADLQGESTNTVQGRYRYGLKKLRALLIKSEVKQ